MISFEEFKKVEMRIGKIVSAQKAPDADKLLVLEVDFGDEKRQIVSGIADWFTPEDLIDKKLPFITNLEYKKFRGVESQGMLLAVGAEDRAVLLEPQEDVLEGTNLV